jgi:hypothetical protein
MQRLAVAMWDFSWLVRRSGKEAEYADWPRILDEFVERGYNCIRLDAFPHLIGRGNSSPTNERFLISAQDANFPWGNHEVVEVAPAESLLEFMKEMKSRGIRAGLSSWFVDDFTHARTTVQGPEDFASIWLQTLQLLESNDLLDIVEWVDICNEFPLPLWMPAAFSRIFPEPAEGLSMRQRLNSNWSSQELSAASYFLSGAIRPLQKHYPDLRFTASWVYGTINIDQLDLSDFQLLEPHIWIALDPDWSELTGHSRALAREPGGIKHHYDQMVVLWPKYRDQFINRLDKHLDLWARAARDRSVPLVTSEAWGPINYSDLSPHGLGGEWDWVKDMSAEGVRRAIEMGWTGICTSNFCQPHFKGMWADVDWHRQLTKGILQGV